MSSPILREEDPASRPEPEFHVAGALPPRRTLEALPLGPGRPAEPTKSLAVISIAATILAIIGVAFALHAARPILLPLTTAFVISLLLAPAADWLGRRGIPEELRAAIIVFATVGGLAAAFYFVGRPAIEWTERLPEVVTEAREKLAGVEKAVSQVEEVSREVQAATDISDDRRQPQEVVVRSGRSVAGTLATTARTALVQILFTSILVYFLLATRTSFRVKALAARRTLAGKLETARILRDMQRNVGAYMLTMLLINLGLGAVVALGLAAIGMPSPVVWGLLAGVLNFVPYLGPAIVTILLGISGVVHYDTLAMAAAPAAIYVAANFIESNFVTPSFVGVRLMISPLAIIVAIAFLTWMWGPVGAVIAIPLVVVVKTICDSVKPLNLIGVLLGEVQVVKARKVGFWRVDTVGTRARHAPAPVAPSGRRGGRRRRVATF